MHFVASPCLTFMVGVMRLFFAATLTKMRILRLKENYANNNVKEKSCIPHDYSLSNTQTMINASTVAIEIFGQYVRRNSLLNKDDTTEGDLAKCTTIQVNE